MRMRILIFLLLTFKRPTKNRFFLKFFCLLHFDGIFNSVFKDKKSKRSHKTVGINVFQLFLLDHSRIQIRTRTRICIHGTGTSDEWIRIREAQKHSDPVDPDSDPTVQCDYIFSVFVRDCLTRLNLSKTLNLLQATVAEVITDGSIESLEQYLDIDELPDPEAEPAPAQVLQHGGLQGQGGHLLREV